MLGKHLLTQLIPLNLTGFKLDTMAKDSYYFQHDYDPLSDPKLNALVAEFGAVGYGIYWRIVEMLHSDAEHKLCHKRYVTIALAKQMSTSIEQIENVLEFAIDVCELFESDGSYFWSNRVLRNMDKRVSITEKRSKAGKISAQKRKNSTCVEQVPTCVEHISTKERKGKEIKDNKEAASYFETFFNDVSRTEAICMRKGINKIHFNRAKKDFTIAANGQKEHETYRDFLMYFENWLNLNKKNYIVTL